MNPDKLEEYLNQRPARQLPGGWREQILQAAVAAGERRANEPLAQERSWTSNRVNWGALAAAWIVTGVLALNSDGSARSQKASDAAFVTLGEHQRERERVLAELTGKENEARSRGLKLMLSRDGAETAAPPCNFSDFLKHYAIQRRWR